MKKWKQDSAITFESFYSEPELKNIKWLWFLIDGFNFNQV